MNQAAIQVIKTEAQYREYMAEVERLSKLDPKPGTPEGNRLELLATLIESYERQRYHMPLPNPIDAILFRMEQRGLQKKDLVPYFGTKSRVSEVLSGKRQLTVEMIRRLSAGLDIPAQSLLGGDATAIHRDELRSDSRLFPVRELVRRGVIPSQQAGRNAEELAASFFARLGGLGMGPAFMKRQLHTDSVDVADIYELNVWLALVLIRSREVEVARGAYHPPKDPATELRDLARISGFREGPLLAREYLGRKGIALVVEPKLARTRIDGAALLDSDGTPVIGLTLRHDRLDNFWFTLLHEAAHIFLHLRAKQDAYIDDIEGAIGEREAEAEANRVARDALIPRTIWAKSAVRSTFSVEDARRLASELHVSPAVVAGRVRRETGDYSILRSLIGQNEVKRTLDARK